jgi:hypothetical protein
MSETYFACPAHTCHCPGRTFRRPWEAYRFARDASEAYHVAYCVWRARDGNVTLLSTARPHGEPAPQADGDA